MPAAVRASVPAGAVGDAIPRRLRRHARGVPLQRRAAAHALVLLAQLRLGFLEGAPVAPRRAEVADAVRRLVVLVAEVEADVGFLGPGLAPVLVLERRVHDLAGAL